MDKLKTLQTDLKAAQKVLTDLQGELPQFHSLLTDNEQNAQRLKSERASLDAQAQAKNRVMVAREMLEQHRADLANAQAEVNRLEALEHREGLLLEMCSASREAATHRAGIDRAVEAAQKALGQAATTIYREWAAERAARQSFVEAGKQLVPALGQLGGHWDVGNPDRTALETLKAELCERGAALEAVTDSTTGRYTALDTERRGLPRDALTMLIWQAFNLLIKGQPESIMLTRYAPSKVNPNAPIPEHVAPELVGR